MARILSIDFGRRRCGIAVTDPLCIVANGLTTVETSRLHEFVCDYIRREEVSLVLVGHPTDMHGNDSDSMRYINPSIGRLQAHSSCTGGVLRRTFHLCARPPRHD